MCKNFHNACNFLDLISINYVQPATKAVSPLVPFCDTLYPQAWEFQVEKCLTSIDKRKQKRHTPRILESMNDMDLLSHNDIREATLILLLSVHARGHTYEIQYNLNSKFSNCSMAPPRKYSMATRMGTTALYC